MQTSAKFFRHPFALLLSSILICSVFLPVLAQTGFSIIVYPPDISEFPKVSLYLDAYDGQGRFISGLDLNSFSVLEDGFEMPVNESQLLEPGLHTIIAANLGATLSNRANASVPTRFEAAVFNVASWLNDLRSGGTNQYSLTSNEGILVEKLQEKDAFTFQLQNYKPNLFNFEPDLTSLSLALDIASKPNLIDQSKQSILYITPLPLDTDLPDIISLQQRALDLRVPVNVWLMAPDTAANSPAAIALNKLAVTTGGKFLLYTEETPSPDPEDFVGVLRSIYLIRYTSDVNQSGAHTVSVKARYGSEEAISPETPFSIDLTIPSAVLVDVPTRIDRVYSNATGSRELQPEFITIQAEVVFPDGYSRQLEATRLYVDGAVIAENSTEPFNFFPWSLKTYTTSGEHLVAVEVEDILGFRSISQPRPIYVSVESLYPGWVTSFLRFFNAGGWIALAAIGLGGAAFTGVRIQRSINQRTVAPSDEQLEYSSDPLLQSVPGLSDDIKSDSEDRYRRTVYAQSEDLQPKPHLQQVGSSPFEVQVNLFITSEIKIIGRDAQTAAILLDHPSVNLQHARIRQTPAGSVGIADMRSTTGTWVNYVPISPKGTVLKEGDLIKIGEFTFRYHLGFNGEER